MADISFPVYGEVYAKNGDKIAPNTPKVEQGWVQEMMPFQYENWLQNRQDVAITYLLQKGIPEYNAAQEYVANKSVVLYVGIVYLATSNGLLGIPTDTSQWRKLSVTLDSNGIVPVASGGTGATTPSQARANLGLGTASTLNADFVVQKDIDGNFSAGTITATLVGNATTSSSWLIGRTISLSGAVTGTSSAWKGDGNLTITTTSIDATKLAGEVPSASLPLVVKKSSDTGIAYIPMGTTPERPATPTAPGTRINSTTGMMEFWNGSAWISVTGGAESYFSTQLQGKVDRTSTTGAAILPSGTEAERPNPAGYTSKILVRGNITTGKPEWYDQTISKWSSLGIPEFSSVPASFVGGEINVTTPHLRKMVWDNTQSKYVRAPWHQPCQLFFSYDNPASISGALPVRGDVTWNQADFPDVVERLGLSGTGTFTLEEARGEGVRVLDNGLGVDAGRALASKQLDAMQSLGLKIKGAGSAIQSAEFGPGLIGGTVLTGSYEKFVEYPASLRFTTETRMRNIAFPLWMTI